MESILNAVAGMLFVILLLIIVIYVAVAMFLNNFNKLMYGKGTWMAWVPIADMYLLGKLTVNNIFGWVLVVLSLLNGQTSVTVNGETTTYTFLPSGVSKIYNLFVLGLFIYAIVKYNKLKKENNGVASVQSTVPTQPQVMNESVQPVVQPQTMSEPVQPVVQPQMMSQPVQPVAQPQMMSQPVQPVAQPQVMNEPVQPVVQPQIMSEPVQPVAQPQIMNEPVQPVMETGEQNNQSTLDYFDFKFDEQPVQKNNDINNQNLNNN